MAKQEIDFMDFRIAVRGYMTEADMKELADKVALAIEGVSEGLPVSVPYICTVDGERLELG